MLTCNEDSPAHFPAESCLRAPESGVISTKFEVLYRPSKRKGAAKHLPTLDVFTSVCRGPMWQ